MAKLPDMPFNRGVPAPAAGTGSLPAKLQAANALASTGSRIANTLERAYDRDAQRDAQARSNAAQRNYMQGASELTDMYLQDLSLPADQYVRDMTQLRERSVADANAGASRRVRYHLAPKLDAYRTQVQPAELAAAKQLLDARTLLRLDSAELDTVATVQETPAEWESLLADLTAEIDDAEFPEAKRVERAQQATHKVMTTAFQQLLEQGDLKGADALRQHEQFKQLPPAARVGMTNAMQEAQAVALGEFVDEAANNMLVGNLPPAAAFRTLEAEVDTLGDLAPPQREQLVSGAKDDLAYMHLSGLLVRDQHQQVLALLKEPRYADVLSQNRSRELYAQAQAGATSGSAWKYNAELAAISVQTDKLVKAVGIDPLAAGQAATELKALQQQGLAIYQQRKKEPDKSFFEKMARAADAVNNAAERLHMMRNPAALVATQATARQEHTPESALRYDLATDVLNERRERIATDSVEMFRLEGGLTTPLPPDVRDPQFITALAERAGSVLPVLDNRYGPEHSGMLNEAEVDQINLMMERLNSTDSEALFQWGGEVHNQLGATDAARFFKQLSLDSGTDNLPYAMMIAARGGQFDTQIAREVLNGSELMRDKSLEFDITDRGRVQEYFRKTVGEALGDTYFVDNNLHYDNAFKATMAIYFSRMHSGANRGKPGFNRTVLESAIKDAVGEIIEVGGSTMVAPAPGVTSRHIERWMQTLDESNAPRFADGDGNEVPLEDIRKYALGTWGFDRFLPVSTGEPGHFYLRDLRGTSADGIRNNSAGSLLWDADRPGELAVLVYDPAGGMRQLKHTPEIPAELPGMRGLEHAP